MPPASVIFLEYVCPALGTLFANLMFFAPYKDLQSAIRQGQLGDLNPTPWAFMLGNCFGWVLYGMLLQNLWIFFANAPGFILSVWLNLGAAKLNYSAHHSTEMRKSLVDFLQEQENSPSSSLFQSTERIRDDRQEETEGQFEESPNTTDANGAAAPTTTTTTSTDWAKVVWDVTSQSTPAPTPHENLVMMMVLIWMCCVSVIAFANELSTDTQQFIVCLMVNFNLVFFYGAPLSTILQILKERHTASIHIATMITNTCNGSFWTAYGIAVNDYWIYVPNGLGAGLGFVQIFLCVIFPRTRREEETNRKEESSKDGVVGGDEEDAQELVGST